MSAPKHGDFSTVYHLRCTQCGAVVQVDEADLVRNGSATEGRLLAVGTVSPTVCPFPHPGAPVEVYGVYRLRVRLVGGLPGYTIERLHP